MDDAEPRGVGCHGGPIDSWMSVVTTVLELIPQGMTRRRVRFDLDNAKVQGN